MIVGIDTEYVSPDPQELNHDIIPHVDVVSYQYHVRCSSGQIWQDLVFPVPGTRLTLGQLLLVACSKGSELGLLPNTMPEQIFLVGHYTRADLPLFSDFEQFRNSLTSVRNTFITQGNRRLRLPVLGSDGERRELQVRLKDAYLLAPSKDGSKSLSAIGDFLGLPKLALDQDPRVHRLLIQDIRRVAETNVELFEQYALRDAEIAARYAEWIGEFWKAETGSFGVPSTLSSIGVSMLRMRLDRDGRDILKLLGQEKVKDKKWKLKGRRYRTFVSNSFIAALHCEVDFVTECTHGGRNEQYWFGPSYAARWIDWDLASAYPTAMAAIGTADWHNPIYTTDTALYTPTSLGYARIRFRFPEDVRYPTIPVRVENGLIFPREGTAHVCSPEIFLAIQLGADVIIEKGLLFPASSPEPVFGGFIKDMVERRARAHTDLEKAVYKEITNSVYGKTAQGLGRKRCYDMRADDTRPMMPSMITSPFFAAFTTSFVRALLGEIMNGLPAHTTVFSCTTDGFITDALDQDVRAACEQPLGLIAKGVRAQLLGKTDPAILEKKHEAEELLGWKTRGQATLRLPTDSSTQPRPDGKVARVPRPLPPSGRGHDARYILAKAGIKTRSTLVSRSAQNKEIVDLFKERSPHDRIEVEHLIGNDDMIDLGTDLITVKHRQRLSMEYDFKRCPAAVGTHYRGHVVFATVPWKSQEHYQIFRTAVEEHQKQRPICIKTAKDYQALVGHAFHVLSLVCMGKKSYTNLKDPDLQTLRRSLCRAFAAGVGGLSYKSASTLARDLTVCGIPASKKDIENARQKMKVEQFEPNLCEPTPRCVEAVDKLRKLYRQLDPQILFYDLDSSMTARPICSAEIEAVLQNSILKASSGGQADRTNISVWDA